MYAALPRGQRSVWGVWAADAGGDLQTATCPKCHAAAAARATTITTADGRTYPDTYAQTQAAIFEANGVVQHPEDCGTDDIPCYVCSECEAYG